MTQKIKVEVEIKTDGKYCDEACEYYDWDWDKCSLFHYDLEKCLGGGPLRCKKCLATEE